MKSVFALVYCDDDMIPSYEGIAFECSNGPKVITISENMSPDASRKTIFYTNEGYKILLDFFYRQSIYVSDDYVEYDCMKLKCDDDVEKIFFIYLKFSIKGPIELNETFRCFPYEMLVLLYEPRKLRTVDEIIVFCVMNLCSHCTN